MKHVTCADMWDYQEDDDEDVFWDLRWNDIPETMLQGLNNITNPRIKKISMVWQLKWKDNEALIIAAQAKGIEIVWREAYVE